MGGRERRDREIKGQAEEGEPQSLKTFGRAVQRSEQRVEVLMSGSGASAPSPLACSAKSMFYISRITNGSVKDLPLFCNLGEADPLGRDEKWRMGRPSAGDVHLNGRCPAKAEL
jgi:hypothetical protein